MKNAKFYISYYKTVTSENKIREFANNGHIICKFANLTLHKYALYTFCHFAIFRIDNARDRYPEEPSTLKMLHSEGQTAYKGMLTESEPIYKKDARRKQQASSMQ